MNVLDVLDSIIDEERQSSSSSFCTPRVASSAGAGDGETEEFQKAAAALDEAAAWSPDHTVAATSKPLSRRFVVTLKKKEKGSVSYPPGSACEGGSEVQPQRALLLKSPISKGSSSLDTPLPSLKSTPRQASGNTPQPGSTPNQFGLKTSATYGSGAAAKFDFLSASAVRSGASSSSSSMTPTAAPLRSFYDDESDGSTAQGPSLGISAGDVIAAAMTVGTTFQPNIALRSQEKLLGQENQRRRNLILREMTEFQRLVTYEREIVQHVFASLHLKLQLAVVPDDDDDESGLTPTERREKYEHRLRAKGVNYEAPEVQMGRDVRKMKLKQVCGNWKSDYRGFIQHSIGSKATSIGIPLQHQECSMMKHHDALSHQAENIRTIAAKLIKALWEKTHQTSATLMKLVDSGDAELGDDDAEVTDEVDDKEGEGEEPAEVMGASISISSDQLRSQLSLSVSTATLHGTVGRKRFLEPQGDELKVLFEVGAHRRKGATATLSTRPPSPLPDKQFPSSSQIPPRPIASRPNSAGIFSLFVPPALGGRSRPPSASLPPEIPRSATGSALQRLSRPSSAKDPVEVLELSLSSSPPGALRPPSASTTMSTLSALRKKKQREESLFEEYLRTIHSMRSKFYYGVRDINRNLTTHLSMQKIERENIVNAEDSSRTTILDETSRALIVLKRDLEASLYLAMTREGINAKYRKLLEAKEENYRRALIDFHWYDTYISEILVAVEKGHRQVIDEIDEANSRVALMQRFRQGKENASGLARFHQYQYDLWKREMQKRNSLIWQENDCRSEIATEMFAKARICVSQC